MKSRGPKTQNVLLLPIRIIVETYRTLIESWPGRAWEKHNIGHWHSSEHVISRDHEPRARSWSPSAHVGSVRVPVRSSELETNLRKKKHTLLSEGLHLYSGAIGVGGIWNFSTRNLPHVTIHFKTLRRPINNWKR